MGLRLAQSRQVTAQLKTGEVKVTKLNEKQRAEVKVLLEDYQTICDMLSDVDRKLFRVLITSESDDKDFADVAVSRKGAKVLLQSEKEQTEAELKTLGIEV